MKRKHYLIVLFLVLLTACGYRVDYKTEEDRKHFTEIEIEEVQEKITSLKGVEEFEITSNPEGIFSHLKLEQGLTSREIESLIKEAFYSMKRETNKIVDLYVRTNDEQETLLAQVYKPPYQDKEDIWTILYEEK